MDSLSPECTPLKHRYDSCFNAWFEGFLQPVVMQAPQASTSAVEEAASAEPERLVVEDEEVYIDVEPVEEASDGKEGGTRPGTPAPIDPDFPTYHLLPSLREDDVHSHPDLYPFLSRRPPPAAPLPPKSPISTAPLPELEFEYAEFTDDEEVEELAESDLQAITNEFGPEDALFEFEDATVAVPVEVIDAPVMQLVEGMTEEEMRKERSRLMAEEYERNCGGLWRDYRACLQRAIDANQPLSALLEQARSENPLGDAVPLEGGGYGAAGSEP